MQEIKNHTVLDQHIIRTLLYFDIFDYPLKGSEVFRFLGMNSIGEKDVIESLETLNKQHHVFKFGEFYSVRPVAENVSRRLNGNKEAQKFLPIALKQSDLISRFPYVRAVMASGSLSKDYMDENCDLDFFIITTPRRLWICRTLLVLYKRLFLKNSHKLFCVNYFVDSEHLEIEEKNLFTATELATVIPLYGSSYYRQLHEKNYEWLIRFFPNFKPRMVDKTVSKPETLKNFAEKIIDIFFGNLLDKAFMRLTLKRWKKIYNTGYTEKEFNIAFKTKPYASKNHPRNFQKKVMDAYQQRLEWFGKKIEME